MRIQFERTGGFGGMRVAATIDTASLPPDQARELSELVSAAGFFNLPKGKPAPAKGADRFQYKLTVESEGRHNTVEVGEETAPESLRPLLRRLTALARSPRAT